MTVFGVTTSTATPARATVTVQAGDLLRSGKSLKADEYTTSRDVLRGSTQAVWARSGEITSGSISRLESEKRSASYWGGVAVHAGLRREAADARKPLKGSSREGPMPRPEHRCARFRRSIAR